MNNCDQNYNLGGIIYKLSDNTNGNTYYGSTKHHISKRISEHMASYARYKKGLGGWIASFDIICNGNFTFSVIEKLDTLGTRKQLLERERYYIENNDCLNKQIPNRSKMEYYIDNQTKLRTKMTDHYQMDINNYRTNKLLRYKAKKEKLFDNYLTKMIIQELK
jgi:hypothetical protein